MGNRLLHIGSDYLWCAFLVLALVPGLANAAPTYVKTKTPGVTEEFGQFFMRENLQNSFNNKQLTTTSTVNAGKQLSIPSKWTASATAPKYAARAAKMLGPLGLGAELLAYALQNFDLMQHDDEFVKDVDDGVTETWVCSGSFYCPVVTGTYSSAEEICQAQADARNGCCGPDNQFAVHSVAISGSSASCFFSRPPKTTAEASPVGHASRTSQTQGDPTIIDLDPSDWEVIEDKPGYPELSDQQLDDLKKTPIGVPVEAPEFPSLPEIKPLSSPYQKPGPTGSPDQGLWEQVIARLLLGYRDRVIVETRIIPVTGPQGIDDPITPYDPNRLEQPVDFDPRINEDGSIDVTVKNDITVEFCKPGDTRLMCLEVGVPESEEIPNDQEELTYEHDPVVFVEGACPNGPTASTPWGSVYFDMYWPCEFATAIKPIVLAAAMFAAVYIFVGGLRTE